MPPYRPALERFLDKIICLDEEQGGCWQWLGSTFAGYGRMKNERGSLPQHVPAHRWAYEHFVGPIPEAFEVHHLCEVPACVNPDHLAALSRAEHTRLGRNESAANARKTHCKHGHEFTEANTYRSMGGRWRACRTCRRLNQRSSTERGQ